MSNVILHLADQELQLVKPIIFVIQQSMKQVDKRDIKVYF